VAEANPNSRLEAFSDGVFAIALTLLILDVRVPSSEDIKTISDLWLSLKHLLPSVLAFLLSFAIVFITWANHHATLKLVDKSSPSFLYANGLLLLAVVVLPFPTALLGEYVLTAHAAPAVVLYSAVDALLAIGWILLTRAALKPSLLTKNEKSAVAMRNNNRNGYVALAVYVLCAVAAFWFPLLVAVLISAIWIGWAVISLRVRS
jgi:uncharacterized membrane protein